MPWLQLSLCAAEASQAERLEEALLDTGAISVTFEDAADQPVFEPAPGETPMWGQIRVIGLFTGDSDMDKVQESLRSLLDLAQLPDARVTTLPERDWTRVWMDDFRPMSYGNRLWVCPDGFDPPEPAAINLRLDPGLAFGTGTHATTALCLEWLDAHELRDCQVLDFGCGSGILAIAALLLGARHAWAVDNDPQALLATRDNAEKNGVDGRISAIAPEELPALQADVVLANILAAPLISLAPRMAALTRPGGLIVLSGILESQASAVAEAYEPWFRMQPPAVREDWVRLEGRRH